MRAGIVRVPNLEVPRAAPATRRVTTSDVTDPTLVRFQVFDSTSGQGTGFSHPVAMQWNPLTSANAVNQNPIPAP